MFRREKSDLTTERKKAWKSFQTSARHSAKKQCAHFPIVKESNAASFKYQRALKLKGKLAQAQGEHEGLRHCEPCGVLEAVKVLTKTILVISGQDSTFALVRLQADKMKSLQV